MPLDGQQSGLGHVARETLAGKAMRISDLVDHELEVSADGVPVTRLNGGCELVDRGVVLGGVVVGGRLALGVHFAGFGYSLLAGRFRCPVAVTGGAVGAFGGGSVARVAGVTAKESANRSGWRRFVVLPSRWRQWLGVGAKVERNGGRTSLQRVEVDSRRRRRQGRG